MLPKILQAKVVPVVTRCLVAELKKHPENSDIALMAKRLEHIPCSHGDAHVSAAECIASVVAENATAEVKYFVATQNNDIQQKVKHMIGVPLLFWYNNILTLHEPSQFQQWFALQVREIWLVTHFFKLYSHLFYSKTQRKAWQMKKKNSSRRRL